MNAEKQPILQRLMEMQDLPFRDFQRRLIPSVDEARVIGVRTPQLRALARKLRGTAEGEAFLAQLPHFYFEENQLHAFMIEGIRDWDACIGALEEFLPHIDNWATCDQLCPKVLGKNLNRLSGKVEEWMAASHAYTVRFGVGMRMRFYLDAAFRPEYLDSVAALRSDEYYVRMMVAWFFATALAKQWDAALPFLQEGRLDVWCHNKTIQKAIESDRIPADRKEILRKMRIGLGKMA